MSQSFLIYKSRCFMQKFETEATYFSLGEIQGFFDSICEIPHEQEKSSETAILGMGAE